MELANYLSSNIPLFCVSIAMIFIALRNIKFRKKESIYFLVFTFIVLFLSVVVELEVFSQKYGHPILGTIFTSIGYITRPILLFIFILLANMDQKRPNRFFEIWGSLMIINVIIYSFPLFFNFEPLGKLVFYYQMNADGTASFTRGTFLNFTSHIISAIYLGLLIFVALSKFHGKHRRDGWILLLTVLFIAATVITEVLASRNDLLNVVAEICAMINYIFIVSVNTSKDSLTDLYDRRAYYEDVSRYRNEINGVIQIDMNGLKRVNDVKGHDVGDKALKVISHTIRLSINKDTMCAYRLSGDEFLVIMMNGKEEDLKNTAEMIENELSNSEYSASVGCYFISNGEQTTFEEALRKAEGLMYKNKIKYYKDHNLKQRER